MPMLTISSSLPTGVSEATSATTSPMLSGEPDRRAGLGRDVGDGRGSRLSRLIANVTRTAPISSVITTVVRPATAPAEISVA